MKVTRKLQRFLSILLACVMVMNVPMSALAFEDVTFVETGAEVSQELGAEDEDSFDIVLNEEESDDETGDGTGSDDAGNLSEGEILNLEDTSGEGETEDAGLEDDLGIFENESPEEGDQEYGEDGEAIEVTEGATEASQELAAEESASDQCGAITNEDGETTNLQWSLDSEGVLTISGSGAMADYESASDAPWYDYINSISSVVIASGVTSIGGCAFYYYKELTSLEIANTVTSIGEKAVYRCTALTKVTIPASVTTIGEKAFYQCSAMTTLELHNSATMGDECFRKCYALNTVILCCNNITSDMVTAIEYDTKITNIVVGKSMQSIPSESIALFTNATNVTVDPENPYLQLALNISNSNVFPGNTLTLEVTMNNTGSSDVT